MQLMAYCSYISIWQTKLFQSGCRKKMSHTLPLSILHKVEVGRTQWSTSKFNMVEEKLLKLLKQTNNYIIKHILLKRVSRIPLTLPIHVTLSFKNILVGSPAGSLLCHGHFWDGMHTSLDSFCEHCYSYFMYFADVISGIGLVQRRHSTTKWLYFVLDPWSQPASSTS